MLNNPVGTNRRIFVYGDIGTRKTSSGLDIAWWAQKSGSDARFYAADTDFAISNIMVESDRYSGLRNVTCTGCHTFDVLVDVTDSYCKLLRPQDWLIIDIMSETWGYVQTAYVNEIYDKDYAEHMEAMRKSLQAALKTDQIPPNLQELSGYADWKVINAKYFKWRDKILKGNKFNVFATAHQKQLDRKENEHTTTYYGRIGYKPDGQKGVDGLMDTVIYMRYDGDNWYMTSVKDRFREKMVNVRLNDFVLSYLVPYGRWKLT